MTLKTEVKYGYPAPGRLLPKRETIIMSSILHRQVRQWNLPFNRKVVVSAGYSDLIWQQGRMQICIEIRPVRVFCETVRSAAKSVVPLATILPSSACLTPYSTTIWF